MRFVVRVDNNWLATFSCAELPEKSYQRAMYKCPDGRNGYFPTPVPTELPPEAEPHFALCTGDAQAFWRDYENITNRSLAPDTTERFGRYLFEALIGKTIWTSLLNDAEAAGDQFIELCLCWDRNAGELHRLNWEMMHGPDRFLFLERTKRIAITRMAPGTADIVPRSALLPPRMLFVIGTSLNDTQIRAGAEYLGLLRQLKCNERSIHSRVLQRASPQQLMEAMKSFKPDVVHFICHGGFNSIEGHGYLELELDEKELARERYAPQLFNFLSACGLPPSIVILSACSTGTVTPGRMLGAHELAPLAVELVTSGIPVVIGMGGQISDLACRLFTRRLGEALMLGEPLVKATSEGRRAAFAEGAAPHTSADWAFPTVFMAEGVAPDYIPVRAGEINTDSTIDDWIRRYQVDAKPGFCSREEFLHEYYELFKARGSSVLVAYVDEHTPGYGRTRLLQQLATIALRDGHVPCFIGSNVPDWLAPQTVGKLCIEILRAIGSARNALNIEPPVSGLMIRVLKTRSASPQLQQIAQDYQGIPKVYFGQLIDYFSRQEIDITVETFKEALQADLVALIADARAKYPAIIKEHSRPLLLLDEVNRYDKAIHPLFNELFPLFYEGQLEGSDRTFTEQVPVVMTMSFGTFADEQLRPIREKAAARSWIKFKQLKRFEKGEDMLAYEQVLLHPFADHIYTGISDKAWAFDYGIDPEIVDFYEKTLRLRLDGIPSDFLRDRLFNIVEFAIRDNFVIAADDEVLLDRERARQ